MALKVTLVMNYCDRDQLLAQKNAALLKAIYPNAAMVLVNDNPRLKLAPSGGQWTERWMTAALPSGRDIIIKLDPDTRALKAVTTFPTTDIFGQLAPIGTYYPKSTGIICGGAIGFQASAVKKILDSGFLRDTKYVVKPYITEERRFGHPRDIVQLQDPIVHDIAHRLGLSEGVWDGLDLMMSWEPVRPFKEDATFVHPVKS